MARPVGMKEFAGAEGYLTPTPGTEVSVESFEVFEVPKFFPTGEGSHTWALVEKVNRNTIDVVKEIADFGKVNFRDVGYAGLKDKNARTLQWISSPGNVPEKGEGFRCLVVKKSGKKIQTGNLLGNWFRLVFRPESLENAEKTLSLLDKVPNFFGFQRFGECNAEIGELLIKGETKKARELMKLKRIPFERKFFCLMEDSFTSYLFNLILSERLVRPQIEGDVISRYGPAGPVFGKSIRLADGEAGRIERAVLERQGLSLEQFRGEGKRRPFFIPMKSLSYAVSGDKIEARFFLPKGAYATSVLRELAKEKLTSSSFVSVS